MDISPFEQVLLDNTGPLHERVREFLSEFGGLHVQSQREGNDFQTDPRLATKNFHIDEEGLSDYSAHVGAPVCCVGVASRALMMLLMDPAGRMFAVMDDLIYLAGNSPHVALESLCSGRPLHELGSAEAGPE
ncbi:SUKH-3 domain-containing protein [Cystobacter ferrugineus]|uniref:Uncharacterized protein n=1 Tax=Cystobacter ferrugineus TaxID=83449 RepID=A0A1L9B7C5_9BACT|nr:SUKH-3 domain-containing protein [Cystobacter ferrugineus]OJH38155.1 hypothetical protein BON30_23675 [Cystobacter ferrugineus]